MKPIRSILVAVMSAAVLLSPPVVAAGFVDVLDSPAVESALASKGLLQGVARAGDALVAVGQRGHIVVSTDGGATWKQGKVPVASDLTAVYFVGDKKGWAVGHDGVILNTVDGGATWALQLDGRKANDLLLASLESKAAAAPASEPLKAALVEAKRYKEQGADKPFLDVWFSDENTGYAVGAYNLIFHTRDGGKTWESWFERTENPKFFNLYAIRPAGGTVFIAGEGGLVLKLDPAGERFVSVPTPYNGSYFGVADAKSAVVVFGLRGNVYRTDDGGKAWAKVETGLTAAVVGGATSAKGELLLADAGGRIVASEDAGKTYQKVTVKNPLPLFGLADAGNGRLALVGPRGVAVAEPTR
jgi:photosystem II stability/assembly factor-like uncharacterized protein